MVDQETRRQLNTVLQQLGDLARRVGDLEHRVGLLVDKRTGHTPVTESGSHLKPKSS